MMTGAMHDDMMKISLVCGMSRRRMNLPARGIDCTHVQVNVTLLCRVGVCCSPSTGSFVEKIARLVVLLFTILFDTSTDAELAMIS
jgi:hypothetical protein